MNREIKFRIWYPEEKRMVFKGALTFDMKDGSWLWEGRHGSFHSHFGNLMQFTGLKDKNGKEIYEGDILKMVCKGDKRNGQIMHNFVDYFSGGTHCGFRLRNKSYSNNLTGNRIYNGEMEIIGNIYENPDLLK